MKEARVIVAGGRYFNDYEFLKRSLAMILSKLIEKGYKIEIVSGKAKGADSLGERFAKEMGLSVAEFPADWDQYGKAAGHIRNKQMAEYASENGKGYLVAFWDGESRGTKNMIDTAKKMGLEVGCFKYE